MAGLVFPRKVAVDLAAASDAQSLTRAVTFAATERPPLGQRKLKYRMVTGIGTYKTKPLDVRAAQEHHRLQEWPAAAAVRVIVLPDFFVDALVADSGIRFRAVNSSDNTFNALAASYPWVDAIATRSAEFLSNNGIQSTLEPVSMRSW